MGPKTTQASLVADLGGTHVRFALASASGELDEVRTFECADHGSLGEAIESYLAGRGGARPQRAAIAVAAPVRGDRVRLTNHPWSFSAGELRDEQGLAQLEVLNDFAALALAVPALGAEDLREIRPGEAEPGAAIAVLGPGTGLGVAALLPAGGSWLPLATEGGHRDLAATSEREWQVVRHLGERFGHVSVERVLSGPGLVNLYETLSRLAGEDPLSLSPAEVVAAARQGSSPACVEALELFAGWLGAVAGDLALTVGSRGGVYLGGGVLGRMDDLFDRERFRQRFLAKGRFRDYLEPIPVAAIRHPYATLIGAARALKPFTGRAAG